MKIFWLNPKDYIFSFKKSPKKLVVLKPYDPNVESVARNIITDISNLFPKLKIDYLGSTPLKIPGSNDIDIYLPCQKLDFSSYLEGLNHIFGQPKKIKSEFVEWNFIRKGFEIEITMIDPNSKRYSEQIKIFNFLKDDEVVRKNYIKLKLETNGKTEREYTRRKIEFFENLLKK